MTPEENLARTSRIAAEMTVGEIHLFVAAFFEGSEIVYLQHRELRADSTTGSYAWGGGRKWHISPHATDSEVVLTGLKAAITDSEHQVRENFRYRGARIFHPHPDVDVLIEIAEVEDVRKVKA